MASKALLLLGLFAVLLAISEVAVASAKQSGMVKSESEETVQPDQYNGGNGGGNYQGRGAYNGGGHGGNGGGGYNGGGNYNGGRGYNRGGRGGGCRHGCCYRGYLGCSRCCSYSGEAVQTQPGH